MPKRFNKALILFAAATLAGACLHFVYALCPNAVTALFSPVNESLWEHLKIVYWPFLAAGLVYNRGGEKDRMGAWFLALLILSAVMLAVGYVYHVVLSGESLFFDIALYVIVMGGGFLLAAVLDIPSVRAVTRFLFLLVLALCAALVLFTFLPPDNILFADLSRTNTWNTNPYC